jgi:multicomponent Na+:H+ antiporter subunit A
VTAPPRPRRSLILDTVLDMVTRTALLFSAFLLFAGHNAPGGGFVGGLVAATALTLRYVAGGAERVDVVAAVHEATLLGAGLLVAALSGMAGWVLGTGFLDQVEVEAHVPLLGELHATTALAFDIGVYLVVVGLGLALLRSLGAAADADLAHHAERGVAR